MVKVRQITCHKASNAPDHILQEIEALMNKLTNVVCPLIKDEAANIVLSAFNRIHAAMIVTLISSDPDEIKKASMVEAQGLILNIEDISNVKIFPGLGDD